MKRMVLQLAAAVALWLVATYYFWRITKRPEASEPQAPAAVAIPAATPPAAKSPAGNAPANSPAKPAATPAAAPEETQPETAAAAAAASQPAGHITPATAAPGQKLESLRLTIRSFGQRFRGNPVGNNAEITAALKGANPGGVNFLADTVDAINDKGELCDEWGSPYFFHQLSSTEMEIRSAGPDRKMWTGDDLLAR